MVVVVADSILESRRRPGWLNAPEEPFGNQDAERVVYRLERDGTDLGPNGIGHAVSGDVRPTRDGPQHSQPLSRYLNTALPEEVCRVNHRAKNRSTFGIIPKCCLTTSRRSHDIP